MGNKIVPFEASTVYHIYNRSHEKSFIFREKKNYDFFLSRFSKYILPIAHIYAYCLLPNHFHFLIHIKNEDELQRVAKNRSRNKSLALSDNLVKFISNTFGSLFNSYAKSYNKIYNRHGSLFEESLKRKIIDSGDYFTTMIRYIHFNPVFHGMTSHPAEWQYSSYHAFITEKPTHLKRNSVLEWFGGKEAFLKFHHSIQQDEVEKIKHLLFDD